MARVRGRVSDCKQSWRAGGGRRHLEKGNTGVSGLASCDGPNYWLHLPQ